ncbi:MAG TPA: dTDP-4-dehydrorhamnose 3,5-epimerase [Acidimicrobiia bacterium]
MKFLPGAVAGVTIIELEPVVDHRGFFARSWCADDFADAGLKAEWAQSNIQFSPQVGTLRGIHYQIAPFAETKLVRCTRGSVFDVAIDVRPDSPTFGQWEGTELSADSHRSVWVPEGCAHGYLTLEPNTEVFYLTSNEYTPEAVRAIKFDDPFFAISWPRAVELVPPGHESWPLFEGQR